eukprot:Colp12_sorted_trinity150504_noHs@35495
MEDTESDIKHVGTTALRALKQKDFNTLGKFSCGSLKGMLAELAFSSEADASWYYASPSSSATLKWDGTIGDVVVTGETATLSFGKNINKREEYFLRLVKERGTWKYKESFAQSLNSLTPRSVSSPSPSKQVSVDATTSLPIHAALVVPSTSKSNSGTPRAHTNNNLVLRDHAPDDDEYGQYDWSSDDEKPEVAPQSPAHSSTSADEAYFSAYPAPLSKEELQAQETKQRALAALTSNLASLRELVRGLDVSDDEFVAAASAACRGAAPPPTLATEEGMVKIGEMFGVKLQ